MKTKSTWITLMVLLGTGMLFTLFPSCEKIKNAIKVKVNYDLPDQYFSVDSLSHLKSEQLLYSESFTVNIDSIVNANKGVLSDASVSELKMTVLSPDWVTLDWLSSARITLTPLGGAPIEVATTGTINPALKTINFEVKNVDVASVVTGPFQLDMYGNLTGPIPTGSIKMLLESGLEVTVSPN
jgi:hypothetical protein